MPGSPASGSKSREKKAGTDELAALTVPEVRRLLAIALPLPVHSSELRLAWSLFRRRKRLWARRSHYRRRARLGDALMPLHNYGCRTSRSASFLQHDPPPTGGAYHTRVSRRSLLFVLIHPRELAYAMKQSNVLSRGKDIASYFGG